jgi:glycine/D-amino acid oxidase-like deaminating enzyme
MTVTARATRHPAPEGAVPSLWLDGARATTDPLAGRVRADVAIVGGGFTGLWTALELAARDPGLAIVLLEAHQVGYGASGRNGGFVEASLTHGLANGLAHFPDELDRLVALGDDNHRALVAFVREHGIDCGLEETGTLDVATEPWQLAELAEAAELHRRAGVEVALLDAAATRALVDSPRFLGGLHHPHGGALVDPGALVRGLARLARERGVAVHERSPVTELDRDGDGVGVVTSAGEVAAERVVLATNAYSHRLIRRTARHYVPVHDYVLATAPLTPGQRERVGWHGRQGLSDAGNQFHYFRLTRDDRILWGGYDAVYAFNNGVGEEHDHREATYALLERHFRSTFPQLDDVVFTHRWGGPIATTTRFTPVFGDVLDGRVHYALGYTGLGVAASRFAARVLADRLLDPSSDLLGLAYTSTHPFPFPPEPLRWAGVQLTRRAIARADAHGGRRGPWLALLDRFGIGFDS